MYDNDTKHFIKIAKLYTMCHKPGWYDGLKKGAVGGKLFILFQCKMFVYIIDHSISFEVK